MCNERSLRPWCTTARADSREPLAADEFLFAFYPGQGALWVVFVPIEYYARTGNVYDGRLGLSDLLPKGFALDTAFGGRVRGMSRDHAFRRLTAAGFIHSEALEKALIDD
jgi:hypothetical protein